MTGPRLGLVQLLQIRRAPDGAQHGVRARAPADPGELPQSGTYLHQVRVFLLFIAGGLVLCYAFFSAFVVLPVPAPCLELGLGP